MQTATTECFLVLTPLKGVNADALHWKGKKLLPKEY